jgi:2-amino-4-hydroxy-6-hydroxymethyldihydropteridine diphosphokinase
VRVLLMVCYLGLGANIGRPLQQLAAAISALATTPDISLQRSSSVYATKPVGPVEQPGFLNMVVAISTELSPMQLLQMALAIEAQLGRVRQVKNGPRSIDIDILLCSGIISDYPELMLPHPRMAQRQFVLVPLCEIAADLVIPGGPPLLDLLDEDCRDIKRLGQLGALLRGDGTVMAPDEALSGNEGANDA